MRDREHEIADRIEARQRQADQLAQRVADLTQRVAEHRRRQEEARQRPDYGKASEAELRRLSEAQARTHQRGGQ